MSIDYYDRNGGRFFADSAYADLARTHARFLAHVRDGGAILEAGCGSGRDALAFSKAGYAVTAFDGSAKMVELAREHCGLPVMHMRFNEVAWHDAFDGIWSCASLLHVARDELPGVMMRLANALKHGGAWFMSFKHGTTDRHANERYFTDMDESLVVNAIRGTGLDPADVWISSDARPGREGERWTNAIARKI
ncbi:MAG TPA: class I SAM-dependent methyltransferase [Rhizomicrobium sp.]|nr:class I SAM-dependent methyltransferase [Rhizomicrobium sp.]